MNLVDLVVILLAIGYGINGFRTGAVVGILGLAGLCIGAYVGAHLARALFEDQVDGSARVPVIPDRHGRRRRRSAALFSWLGGMVRRRIRFRAARNVDSAIGAVVSVAGLLLVAWLIALPLASSPYPTLSAEIRDSQVLRATDNVLPDSARVLSDSLRKFLDDSGFPQVLDALDPSRIVDVPAPDTGLTTSPGVAAVRDSVLKIRGDAPSCSRAIEGSGFVFADQRVLTNAHVVAGTSRVSVEYGGKSLRAQVVLFDPNRDVAVLTVAGLTAKPLSFASAPAAEGDDSIVVGYPQDGPFDAQPARVRSKGEFGGRDIYDTTSVDRDVYQVRANVRSGNSGGPLITPDGKVLGMVFAKALDSSDTGFVLSLDEINSDATAGRTATAAVATGRCD